MLKSHKIRTEGPATISIKELIDHDGNVVYLPEIRWYESEWQTLKGDRGHLFSHRDTAERAIQVRIAQELVKQKRRDRLAEREIGLGETVYPGRSRLG